MAQVRFDVIIVDVQPVVRNEDTGASRQNGQKVAPPVFGVVALTCVAKCGLESLGIFHAKKRAEKAKEDEPVLKGWEIVRHQTLTGANMRSLNVFSMGCAFGTELSPLI